VCEACTTYAVLYRTQLLPDALLALQDWRPQRQGRPAGYVDKRLRTLGERATARWVRHLRTRGPAHLEHLLYECVPDEPLRQVAERIVYVVETQRRVGNGVLVWFALKRLLGWKAPTGRYGKAVERLLKAWRAEDFDQWWRSPAGRAVERQLFPHVITTRNQPPRRVLLAEWSVDP